MIWLDICLYFFPRDWRFKTDDVTATILIFFSIRHFMGAFTLFTVFCCPALFAGVSFRLPQFFAVLDGLWIRTAFYCTAKKCEKCEWTLGRTLNPYTFLLHSKKLWKVWMHPNGGLAGQIEAETADFDVLGTIRPLDLVQTPCIECIRQPDIQKLAQLL